MTAKPAAAPDYSIVVPVFDEGGAAPALAREIAAAFAGENHEIIFVDDASRDDTKALLVALKAEIPQLRVLGHRKNSGQSRAVRSGVLAARAPIIVTLDGDGQNDPADAPRLARALKAGPETLGLVGGERIDQAGAIGRIVLAVAIQGQDDRRPCGQYPRAERSALARVLAVGQHAQLWDLS